MNDDDVKAIRDTMTVLRDALVEVGWAEPVRTYVGPDAPLRYRELPLASAWVAEVVLVEDRHLDRRRWRNHLRAAVENAVEDERAPEPIPMILESLDEALVWEPGDGRVSLEPEPVDDDPITIRTTGYSPAGYPETQLDEDGTPYVLYQAVFTLDDPADAHVSESPEGEWERADGLHYCIVTFAVRGRFGDDEHDELAEEAWERELARIRGQGFRVIED